MIWRFYWCCTGGIFPKFTGIHQSPLKTKGFPPLSDLVCWKAAVVVDEFFLDRSGWFQHFQNWLSGDCSSFPCSNSSTYPPAWNTYPKWSGWWFGFMFPECGKSLIWMGCSPEISYICQNWPYLKPELPSPFGTSFWVSIRFRGCNFKPTKTQWSSHAIFTSAEISACSCTRSWKSCSFSSGTKESVDTSSIDQPLIRLLSYTAQ